MMLQALLLLHNQLISFSELFEVEKSAALRQKHLNFEATKPISDECKEQLQWWLHHLQGAEAQILLKILIICVI